MIKQVSINTEEVTEKQKNAVQLMTRQASDGVELIVATMAVASTAAEVLQNDIVSEVVPPKETLFLTIHRPALNCDLPTLKGNRKILKW